MATQNPNTEPNQNPARNMPNREGQGGQKNFGTGSQPKTGSDTEINPSRVGNRDEVNLDKNKVSKNSNTKQ